MSDRYVLTTTGEQVFPLNSTAGGKYIDCLFPFGRVSNKGNRGVTHLVRADKVKKEQLGYSFASSQVAKHSEEKSTA